MKNLLLLSICTFLFFGCENQIEYSFNAEKKNIGESGGSGPAPGPGPGPVVSNFTYLTYDTSGTQVGLRTGFTTGTIHNVPAVETHTDLATPQTGTVNGGTVYFIETNAATRWKLFHLSIADGSSTLLREFDFGDGDTSSNNYQPDFFSHAVGGFFYFIAKDTTNGNELWRTDGTPGGTTLVRDIRVGAGDGIDVSWNTSLISNGFLYFRADDGAGNSGIWKSDGTSVGTSMFPGSLHPGLQNPVRGHIYGYSASYMGTDILHIDDAGNAQFLATDAWDPDMKGYYGTTSYFTGGFAGNRCLYAHDTTGTTVEKLGSFCVPFANANIHVLGEIAGEIHFLTTHTGTGNVLIYKTSGTDASTSLVHTLIGDGSLANTIWSLPKTEYSHGVIFCFAKTGSINRCYDYDGTSASDISATIGAQIPGGWVDNSEFWGPEINGSLILKDPTDFSFSIFDNDNMKLHIMSYNHGSGFSHIEELDFMALMGGGPFNMYHNGYLRMYYEVYGHILDYSHDTTNPLGGTPDIFGLILNSSF